MRGSGVTGASIWIRTIVGSPSCTDYCSFAIVSANNPWTGFFFWRTLRAITVLDRNLACRRSGESAAKTSVCHLIPRRRRLLGGHGRNTFTRNVAAKNDEYGYRLRSPNPATSTPPQSPDARRRTRAHRRRTIRSCDSKITNPQRRALQFILAMNRNGSVHGIASIRHRPATCARGKPIMSCVPIAVLLMTPDVKDGVYGVYHPELRRPCVSPHPLQNVVSEPIQSRSRRRKRAVRHVHL